jgi:hypothetical protein
MGLEDRSLGCTYRYHSSYIIMSLMTILSYLTCCSPADFLRALREQQATARHGKRQQRTANRDVFFSRKYRKTIWRQEVALFLNK